jgi:cytochrome c-type biogenesis protein CcmH
MLLWICFALLAAAVATWLLRAPPQPGAPGHDPDLAVYRDQIAELEADASRGVIDPEAAKAARTEIARRLLKHAGPVPAKPGPSVRVTPGQPSAPDQLLKFSALAVPALSLALYIVVGSPSLPGRPLAERLAEDTDPAATNDMIAKVEARLRDKPDDGRGWAVIAPIYLAQGRALDAAQAFARAIRLEGETPDRLAGLGKATILANNGLVTEAARKAYRRLVELDPARVEARYWLAVALEQDGKRDEAAGAYRAILVGAPADAPYRKPVEDRLAAVIAGNSAPVPQSPQSQPSSGISPPVLAPAAGAAAGKAGPTPAEFVAAAQKLAPEMREQMIGRMIAKASDAIKQNPKDVAAWSRVVTGNSALGKSADAASALKEARQALAGDTGALTELDALGKSLGLSS